MAISKIKTGSIEDGTIATGDLADSSITSAKIAANPEFTGTEAAKMPSGTTAQRANAAAGDIRFNTTLSLMEYYDGTNWKSIDAPPIIASVSPTTYSGESGTTITITGSNFQGGATATFITSGGTSYNAAVTTVVSSTSITATTPQDFTVADEPLDIKVTNPSGLASTLADALDCGGSPSFTSASGSLGTIYDSTRSSYSLSTAAATDPDSGGTIDSYAITTGSLPTGLSLNSSTGAITGTATAVVSDTTSSFTIRATDNAGNTNDRAFSITVKAPVVTSFTSTGSSTWTVPTGLSSVQVLLVAGGGAGGSSTANAVNGGGGGAGGLVLHNTFPVTPGGTVSYTVGAGGSGPAIATVGAQTPQSNGGNSTFGSLTALGGGGGGSGTFPSPDGYVSNIGQPGGSGGGNAGWANPSTPGIAGGSGTQPSQSNPGATANGGYPGGQGGNPSTVGGGGGGATARGTGSQDTNSAQGNGGAGYTSSISGSSVTYAGGGGAGGYPATVATAGTGGPGGGGNGQTGGNTSPGNPGTTNRGGGGGGCAGVYPNGSTLHGGNGGPGIIIIKY